MAPVAVDRSAARRPGVATGADLAGGWLDRFLQGAAARGLRIDFVPVHWYGADFDATTATQVGAAYRAAE